MSATYWSASRTRHFSTAGGINRACEIAGIDHRVEDLDYRTDPEALTAEFGPTLMAIAEAAAKSKRKPRTNQNLTNRRLGYRAHVLRRRTAAADLVAARARQTVGAALVSIAESRRPGSDHGDLADRILDAAQRLLVRTGARKLSLSDVATLAGVSRPTIYRYFVSKEELIDALGKRERRRFDTAMAEAMSGVVGVARLEAAVDVVATFVEDQPPGRLLDLEPGFAHEQMAQALPMITEGLMVVCGAVPARTPSPPRWTPATLPARSRERH